MPPVTTKILSLFALFLIPAAAQEAALTLGQIVEKHTEALGGAAKLNAIQNVSMTGKASLMGGQIEAPVIMKMKRPMFMRLEMDMQGKTFVQAFDGATAWMINPFLGSPDPQKSGEEDTKAARDDADFIDGSLVDYKAKGNTLELLGKEDVEGASCYKIKITKKGGSVELEYLDAKTFLPVKSSGTRKQQGQDLEFESTSSNYKPVNGVMIPFSVSQNVNGRPLMELTLDKVEINAPMDDAIFRMPDKPKEEKKDPSKL